MCKNENRLLILLTEPVIINLTAIHSVLEVLSHSLHDLGGNDSACEFSSEVSGLSNKNVWDPRS